MLKELSIHNFKSWRSLDSMRLAPLTALFGANSSGKTSILQLLLMMKQTTESADRKQVLNLGKDRLPVSLGSFQDVIFNHNEEEPLTWSFRWKLPKPIRAAGTGKTEATFLTSDELAFSASVSLGFAKQIAVDSMSYTLSDHSYGMKRLRGGAYILTRTRPSDAGKPPQGGPQFRPLPPPTKCYGFPDQTKAHYRNIGFFSDFELAFEKLFESTYHLGPLRAYPERQYQWIGQQPSDVGQSGEMTVAALLASRRFSGRIGRGPVSYSLEAYVAFWLKKLGLIHSFEIREIKEGSGTFEVRVRRNTGTSDVLITDVGFGVSQVLPALVLCFYVPRGSIILLEQPDIHLHPSVQAGLADVFIDAIKRKNVQIILESHSEHLMRRIQRRIAEGAFKRENAALYFCEVQNGASHIDSLQLDQFGNITNWPTDFFGDTMGEISKMMTAQLRKKSKGAV